MFAGLALVAGFLLFPLAEETDRFFSWTIQPPLTAAFLGAAYWAAFVLIGWAARAATWEEARPALVPVTTIAVLLLVATLIHLDKFDLDSIFGWFWLVVYCTVPPALAVLVWAQARRPAAARRRRAAPIPAPLRAALAAAGVVMGGIGVVMYVEPSTRRGPLAVGAHAAHRARRGRVPDRLRGRGGLRGARTTGSSASRARPTRTRRWARSSCSPPRCSRSDFDGGGALRSTSRSPSRCWRSGLAGSLAVRRAQRG